MTAYSCMTREELEYEYKKVHCKYDQCKAKGLNLNMARGKPAKKQLDLVSDILTVLQTAEDCFDGTIDARNYGELAGLPCAQEYWADMLGCKPEQVFIGGAASPAARYRTTASSSCTRRRIKGISCAISSLIRCFNEPAEKSFAPVTWM